MDLSELEDRRGRSRVRFAPQVDTRRKEATQLFADEEGVSFLKQQISQIHQVRLDNEKKERVIGDLREQVDNLMKYKNEALELRSEHNALEERVRYKEAEVKRTVDELIEAVQQHESTNTTLRSQLEEVETSKAEVRSILSDQIKELEAKLSAMQSDARRREESRAQLEEELARLAMRYEGEAKASADRENAYKEMCVKLRENVKRLESERESGDHRIRSLESRLVNYEEENNILRDEASLVPGLKEKVNVLGSVQKELQIKVEEVQAASIRAEHAQEDIRRTEKRAERANEVAADAELRAEKLTEAFANEISRLVILLEDGERSSIDDERRDIGVFEGAARVQLRRVWSAVNERWRVERDYQTKLTVLEENTRANSEARAVLDAELAESRRKHRENEQKLSVAEQELKAMSEREIEYQKYEREALAWNHKSKEILREISSHVEEEHEFRDSGGVNESDQLQETVLRLLRNWQGASSDLKECRKMVEAEQRRSANLQKEMADVWERGQKEKRAALEEQRENLETTHADAIEQLSLKIRSLEREYENMENRVRKESLTREMLESDVADASERLKEYARAIDVLTRGALASQHRVRLLLRQKELLWPHWCSLDAVRRDVKELVVAIEEMEADRNVPEDGPKKRARGAELLKKFRAGAYVVIGCRRLLAARRVGPLLGNAAYVGREKVFMAPPERKTEESEDNFLPAHLLRSGESDFSAYLRLMSYCGSLPPPSVAETSMSRPGRFYGLMGSSESYVTKLRRTTLGLLKRLAGMETKDAQFRQQYEDSQAEMIRSREKILDLEESLGKSSDIVAFLEERVQELQGENMRMVPEERYHSVREEAEQRSRNLMELNKEKTKLKEEFDRHRSELEDLQRTVQGKSAEIEALKAQIEAQGKQLKDTEEHMRRKAEKMVEIEAQRDRVSREAASQMEAATFSGERLRQADAELEESRRGFLRAESRNAVLERDYGLIEQQVNDLKDELDRIGRESRGKEEIIQTLSEAHSRATKEVAELSAELETEKARIIPMEENLEELERKRKADERERTEWAKARLEMQYLRSAAEAELKKEVDRSIGLAVSDGRTLADSYGTADQLRTYISSLDSSMDRARGVIDRSRGAHFFEKPL